MKRTLLLLFLCVSAFAQRQSPLWTIIGAGASVPGSCSGHTIFIYTTDGSYRYCNGSSFVNPFSGMAMTYPGAGVANSTGSAWGTSYTVGTGANNLVQLNGSSQLPAVSAALLTNFPTLNQSTSGTAANLSGTPALPNGTTVTTQTQGDNSTKAASTAYTDTGLATKAASTAATTVNGQSCALSNTCTVTAAPSGSAGGGLSGTYPNPGVAVPGSTGDVLINNAGALGAGGMNDNGAIINIPARNITLGPTTLTPSSGQIFGAATATATGSELVTNGSFAGSAAGWTLGDCVAYSTNSVTATMSGSCSDTSATTTISLEAGKAYLLTFTVTNNGDRVYYHFGGFDEFFTQQPFESGTFTVLFASSTTVSDTLIFDDWDSNGPATGYTLTNVSLHEAVVPPSLTVAGIDGYTMMAIGGDLFNNVAIGQFTLNTCTGCYNNAAFGTFAMTNVAGGNNAAFGHTALINGGRSGNTALGNHSCPNLDGTSDGNVCIGNGAGPSSPQSNKLFIDNTTRNDPLVGGDFAARIVSLGGTLALFASAADPVCSASGDVRKTWMDTTSAATTHLKVCANVASTPTWVTLVDTTVSTLSSLASVGTITTGTWQATKLGLAYGGTNADLSGTGGTSQVLKQTTLGGAITVARLACSDLSNAATTCSSATAGTPPFSAITAGTNAAALLIGTGGSLGTSGTGTIAATSVTNLTLANTLTTSGNFPLTLTTTASTNVTLPTSGTLVNTTVSTLSSLASVGTITTGTWQATKLGLAYGGTNADLSGTGGTSQVLKQTSVGGAITVAQLACADLSNAASGCSTAAGVTTTSPLSGTTALSLLVNVDFAFTHSQTVTVTALGTSTADAMLLTNTTAAAAGAQQVSPALDQCGQGWKTTATAASQSVCFHQYVLPVQGSANPTGSWNLEAGINGAAFSNVFNVSSSGVVTITGPSSGIAILAGNSQFRLMGLALGFNFSDSVGMAVSDTTGSSANIGMSRANVVISSSTGNGVVWTSGSLASGYDTGLSRNAAGVVEVNNGTAGTFRDLKSRHNLSAGTAPSITSGFGTSPSIAGGDESITITVGSGGTAATGVITFGTAYTNAPNCVAGDNTTLVLTRAATTTTTVTIDSGGVAWTAADKISVVCRGY